MPELKLAVVTGASSGIGSDLAEILAARGYSVVAIARRGERLAELCRRIHVAGGECQALAADLADHAERERVVKELAPNATRIEVLVNNAGFGTHGYFHETDLDRELELIEVNCAALVHLTKRVLPWMLARKRGYIMNVASVAAFQPGPIMAMYYASKAFVLSLSQALTEECTGTGVRVSALCPGPTRTEFQSSAGLAATARAGGMPPMTSRDVARLGIEGLFAGKALVVTGLRNKLAVFLNRILPRRAMARAVMRIQLERRKHAAVSRE
ncbi:MAG: SDR family NAD(P)-dependent oxidoreductase [Gemmatimonadaceae bacterium]